MADLISIDDVLRAGAAKSELAFDDDKLWWLETVPADQGRVTLKALAINDTAAEREITPAPVNVRSRASSYGGGAYDVHDGWIAYTDAADCSVWLISPEGQRHLVAPGNKRYYYGGLQLGDGILLAIREDNLDPHTVITSIVQLPWTPDGADRSFGEVIVDGADFYANAVLSPDGTKLAWTQWNVPAMSWDSSTLHVAPLADTGHDQLIAGDPAATVDGLAVQRPIWADDRTLLFCSDESGFWNLCRWTEAGGVEPLHRDPYDVDLPQWTLDNRSWAIGPHGPVVGIWIDGSCQLSTIRDGRSVPGPRFASVNSIAASPDNVYALVDYPDRPQAVVHVDDDHVTVLDQGPETFPSMQPESIIVDGPRGSVQAWLHTPGSSAELPPLIVNAHGGPTLMTSSAYYAGNHFWLSRGFAVCDVNYAGSSAFGREVRNRLREGWGVTDAEDTIAVVQQLIDDGRVDPRRVVISGSSAGGLTVLRALATSDLFAAGISKYGVTDLTRMVGGPKLEAHYLETLVGPWPAARERYLERSPIHDPSAISSPMLFLQGSDDPIVPADQARTMADAVRAAGLPVAYVEFDGESHGFRSMDAKRRSWEAQLSFVSQILGIDVPDDIPQLAIENFPASQAE